jgi:hypothetical protein
VAHEEWLNIHFAGLEYQPMSAFLLFWIVIGVHPICINVRKYGTSRMTRRIDQTPLAGPITAILYFQSLLHIRLNFAITQLSQHSAVDFLTTIALSLTHPTLLPRAKAHYDQLRHLANYIHY